MQNSKFPFDYQHFDCRDIDDFSESAFDFACERAETYIQYQLNNLSEIDQKCVSILGWLLGAIAGLIGYITVSFSQGPDTLNWELISISFLSLFFLSVGAGILFKSNLYKRSAYLPGAGPSFIFHKDILKWTKDHYSHDEQTKMIKGCYLNELQDNIIYNTNETIHRIKYYRACLWVIVIGLFVILLTSIAFTCF